MLCALPICLLILRVLRQWRGLRNMWYREETRCLSSHTVPLQITPHGVSYHLLQWQRNSIVGIHTFFGSGNSNQGNDPTFCNYSRWVVNVITLGSFGLLSSIKSCDVSLLNLPCQTTDTFCSTCTAQYWNTWPATLEVPTGTPFKGIWKVDWSRAHQ